MEKRKQNTFQVFNAVVFFFLQDRQTQSNVNKKSTTKLQTGIKYKYISSQIFIQTGESFLNQELILNRIVNPRIDTNRRISKDSQP